MQDFRKLQVWNKSMDLVQEIYRVTQSYPKEERYGLVSQMRRSATSIPANISEGAARSSNRDFRNFLKISLGSLNELTTFIEISLRLGYLAITDYKLLINELELLKVMLIKLIIKVDKTLV